MPAERSVTIGLPLANRMALKSGKTSGGARLVIVDDHPLVRDGLKLRIANRSDWTVVGEADDVAEALQVIEQTAPDLVIIDLSLKTGSGLDLIRRIAGRNPQVRILVSSMHDEAVYAERALQAGAHGYVHKQQASQLLIEAITQVLSGRVYLRESLQDRLLSKFVSGRKDEAITPIERLTDRELQVFELIGRGLTVREIAGQLKLSPKTVETYRDRMKKKFGLESAGRLANVATRWVSEHLE